MLLFAREKVNLCWRKGQCGPLAIYFVDYLR